MWVIIEFIIVAIIVLVSITEFFYPMFMGKPLFGSFRKNIVNTDLKNDGDLNDKISSAKEKVQEIKKVQEEIDENFKSAEQLKSESDNLTK